MRSPFIVIAALLAACGGADPGDQSEPRAMNFSLDKTVTYIVATSPGGGYDTYARLIARYMEKHLDGVEIRIRNVPGAGNIVGANQLFVAKPDGLTIGRVSKVEPSPGNMLFSDLTIEPLARTARFSSVMVLRPTGSGR